MAIFSILHLWAYPWKVYDIRRSPIVAAEGGADMQYDERNAYKGGPLGIRAFGDAFNPWDLITAVGRSFRWLFVGRKHREEDISYKAPTEGGTVVKPGKYVPLHDNDSDVNVSYEQGNLNTMPPSYSRPLNTSRGDVGKAGLGERTEGYDQGDDLPAMPLPSSYKGPVEEDTGYHGARSGTREEEWADPRTHWGQGERNEF
jgi:hypothetical protein